MATSFLSRALLTSWQPRVQSVRFRKRINIQRPFPPHFERAKIFEVCKPTFAKKPENLNEICHKNEKRITKVPVDNPYEAILARELSNWFKHSSFIAFFHTNPIKGEEQFKYTVLLKRQDMTYKVYGKAVVARAFTNTRYEPVLQLFNSHQAMVFAESPESVAKLVKMLRRLPQIVLMAGILEGRLLSRSQLEEYAALPDLTTARAQLVSLLSGVASPAARLVSQLNTHQQHLVNQLEQRVEQLKPTA